MKNRNKSRSILFFKIKVSQQPTFLNKSLAAFYDFSNKKDSRDKSSLLGNFSKASQGAVRSVPVEFQFHTKMVSSSAAFRDDFVAAIVSGRIIRVLGDSYPSFAAIRYMRHVPHRFNIVTDQPSRCTTIALKIIVSGNDAVIGRKQSLISRRHNESFATIQEPRLRFISEENTPPSLFSSRLCGSKKNSIIDCLCQTLQPKLE